MAEPALTIPLSPRARAAWRRAADELLIDAIFGDQVFGERPGEHETRGVLPPPDGGRRPSTLTVHDLLRRDFGFIAKAA